MIFHRFSLENSFFLNFVGGPLHPAVGVYWATICFLMVILTLVALFIFPMGSSGPPMEIKKIQDLQLNTKLNTK